jgi:transposase
MHGLWVKSRLGLKEIGKQFDVSYTTASHLVGRVRRDTSANKSFASKSLKHNPKSLTHGSKDVFEKAAKNHGMKRRLLKEEGLDKTVAKCRM